MASHLKVKILEENIREYLANFKVVIDFLNRHAHTHTHTHTHMHTNTNHKIKVRIYSLLDSVGEGEGGMIWENGIEICIISHMKLSRQSRFDAQYWMLGAGALGRPRGMVWGGRREEGSGWGTHVYLWQIHFDIWQNQYNIMKLNKIK